jgi:hypothetical protein
VNTRRLLAVAFCVALTATACGDDDGGSILGGTPTTAAPAGTTQAPSGELGPFLTFSSGQHPFSVDYPAGWSVETDSFGAVVTFLAPLTSDADPFHESVNIVVEDLGGVEIDLDEYVEIAVAQLPGLIPDIQLNDQLDDTMGGVPSKIITYTGSQEGFAFTWVQEVSLYQGSAYVLTYTGLSGDEYVQFRPFAIEIFQSFDYRG